MINWSGDHTTNALWVVLIGSMFTQLIPSISDQSIIQRYQSTTDLPAARRSMWINAIPSTGNTLVFLAVAQSAISTSLNRTSTFIVTDFLLRLGPKKPDAHWLFLAKWLTAGMGVIAVALAIVLAFTKIDSAFDMFQRVLGLTASTVLLYYLQTASRVHFYLYSLIGVPTCFHLGSLVSLFFKTPTVA